MIIDKIRDIDEFKNFFESRPMDDGLFTYDFIINNPHLYCLYDEKEGYLKVYANIYTDDTGKLFFSGAGVRKNMPDNIQAIIKICEAYNDDMYSDTDKKEAKICLLKAGFKKLTDNLYMRCKNG